jgi:glutamate synthase (NADPH/NADH) small chain
MGKATGFLEISRELPEHRPVAERLKDWKEVYERFPRTKAVNQGARCMDCGVPFCHHGCPLGNLIPDWNDSIYRDDWKLALDQLHRTNNFPEFTGRLCPAPCENACVLGINSPAVTIKQIEVGIIDRAFEEGWVTPERPAARTGKKVAVVGSGPAGLAAAAQLNRVGHECTVFERDDRIGGLLRYGIPEFKLEKRVLDRRLKVMEAEGVKFVAGANIGVGIKVEDLRREFDAIVLCCGATDGRDLSVPGRDLAGVHMAMEYLPLQNRRCEGDEIPAGRFISAEDKRVIILGGGDTGADCLGTAHRQGCRSVHSFEIMPRPPNARAPDNPWPNWARVLRTYPAHEEGGVRDYGIMTKRFLGEDGRVTALEAVRVDWVKDNGKVRMSEVPGSSFILECDLVLLALGFVGPERKGPIAELDLKLTERGNVWADESKMTSVPGVFTAGDMTRGQSLIVWAIAEGRHAARGVDRYLMGESELPSLPWTC